MAGIGMLPDFGYYPPTVEADETMTLALPQHA
jgi:hypothetical protein